MRAKRHRGRATLDGHAAASVTIMAPARSRVTARTIKCTNNGYRALSNLREDFTEPFGVRSAVEEHLPDGVVIHWLGTRGKRRPDRGEAHAIGHAYQRLSGLRLGNQIRQHEPFSHTARGDFAFQLRDELREHRLRVRRIQVQRSTPRLNQPVSPLAAVVPGLRLDKCLCLGVRCRIAADGATEDSPDAIKNFDWRSP